MFEAGQDILVPDFIADLHIPDMTGLALPRPLRAPRHSMPIIFLTAYPREQRPLIECLSRAIGISRP